MARTVFVHIGLPKTATTYLQTIFWGERDRLRADGVLVPGEERREHLWASRVIREDRLDHRPERESGAWDRLLGELAEWDGTALISHEFFAAAGPRQAKRMVADLAPAEVHLIVTAREPLGLFTASWQESLKNRATTPMAEYGRSESSRARDIWNWRTLDLTLVLQRWAKAVPPERIHVLPLDRTAPRDEIWHRFAGVLGVDGSRYDTSQSFPNESMGVVEAELLRRVNRHLGDFSRSLDKGVYIRSFLADERLVPRGGESFWPLPDQIEDCRRRGERALEFLAERPFDVVGDAERLRVPDALPDRRTPDSVTDSEVAEAASELVAVLLGDVRELRQELRAARGEDDERTARSVSPWRRWSRSPR